MNIYEIALRHLGLIRGHGYSVNVTYDGPDVTIIVEVDHIQHSRTITWLKWQKLLCVVSLAQWGEQANRA